MNPGQPTLRFLSALFGVLFLVSTGRSAEISRLLSKDNPGLALWLRADTGVGTDGAGGVQHWADQSGYNHHAIQQHALSRPGLNNGSGKESTCVRFNGTNNFLEIPHSDGMAPTNDLAIFAVVRLQNVSHSTNSIFSKTIRNLPAPFDLYSHPPSGEARFFSGDGRGFSFLFGSESIPAGRWIILSVLVRGTNAMTYLNGNFNGIKSLSIPIRDAGGPLRIGTRDDFAHWLKGDIAELLFFRNSISEVERIAIHNYLGVRHGIELAYDLKVAEHPVINRLEGQTATFSASATDPSLHYRWQKNETDIPDATNASYTTPLLRVADSGTRYRVRVSGMGKTNYVGLVSLMVSQDTEPLTTTTAAFLLRDQSRSSATNNGPSIPPPYSSRFWQLSDEPSRNVIQSIAQTSDGYLWFGTGGGLAQFDGENFSFLSLGQNAELTNRAVNALCSGNEGSLWVGTAGLGLFQYSHGKFTKRELPESDATVLTLRRCRDESIWIGTRKGIEIFRKDGLFRRNDRNDILAGPEKASETQTIRAIDQDPNGDVWVAAGVGVMQLRLEAVLKHFFPGPFYAQFIRTVHCGRDGSIWVGANSGLVRLSDGKMQHFSKTNGLPDNIVTAIYEDRRGNLWIGTSGGLCRFANETFIVETTSDGGNYDQILCFFEDRESNLWVGTKNGVHQLRVQQFTSYTTRHGLTHNNVISVYEDQDGSMWIGTWGGGLHHIKGGKISVYSTAKNQVMRNDLILAIAGAREGGIWFGEDYDGGLYRLLEGNVARVKNDGEYGPQVIRALLETRDGRLLIGTSQGALKILENKTFSDFGAPEQFAGKAIRCLLETREGQVWVGTDKGLALKKKEGFIFYSTEQGLSDNTILALFEDEKRTLWIGTAKGGLNRLSNGVFNSIRVRDGMFDDEVQEILSDSNGHFWLTSRRGISRVNRTELENFAEGRISRISKTVFGKADGMSSPVCVGVAKPSAWKSRDGRLWFATTKGLAVTDPALEVAQNGIAPPVVIQKVLCDATNVLDQAGGWNSHKANSTLTLPPARETLEIHYTALSYSTPEKNRFRYKLNGHDTDWVEAGTRRVAYYNNLSPGSYVFRVIGSNNDGVWSEAGAELEILLQPHVWQTWWFQMAGALGGLVLVAGAARFATRKRMRLKMRRLEEQHAVEKERARIAQDIHDDIGATLTQISLLSQLAEKESGNPEHVREYTGKITNTAQDLTQAMDEIVWAINPKNDSLRHLIGYIFRFAEEFFALTDLRLRKERPQYIPEIAISAEVRHNVFLVVKEALNNVVKHSGAREVRLSLSLGLNVLVIQIDDNGHGFVLESPDGFGNGLGNMKKRTEEIGGSFSLTSSALGGTRIHLAVPVPLPENNLRSVASA